MAVEIYLKRRHAQNTITVSVEWLKEIFKLEDAGDFLVAQLEGMMGSVYVHDKSWLLQIINWTPDGGHPLSEAAKWFKLAKRVADLDEEKEGKFTLSDYQVNLIWKRLIDPRYKITGLPPAFIEFVMEFQQASGRHFPEEDPETEEVD